MKNNLSKPDIIQVIRNEGIDLKKSGRYYKACCPFHHEKTPSFTVYPNNSFYCFGCGESGDAIDFIMKHRDMSFKDSLAYLGIKGSYRPKEPDRKQIIMRRLIKEFRQWEQGYYDELTSVYRRFNALKIKFKTMAEAEKYSYYYHKISIYEHRMDILFHGDDKEKYELFKEVKNGSI